MSVQGLTWDDHHAKFLAWWRVALPDETADDLVLKFKEEAKEFIDDPNGTEAVDCIGVLFAWADRAGVDLLQMAAEKLEVCRHRQWARRPDGSYHHIQRDQ